MPRRWFHKRGLECDWDLPTLKDQFWTASHEILARRMLDMPPHVTVTVLDEGEVSWRQSNFDRASGGLLAEEHDAWQQSHAWGTPASGVAMVAGGVAATIRCWPVHEPLWRREIIRTEIACCE